MMFLVCFATYSVFGTKINNVDLPIIMSEEISYIITFDDVKYDASKLSEEAKYCVHCFLACE